MMGRNLIKIFAVSFLISVPLSYLGLNPGYSLEYLLLKFFFWFILGGVVLGILFVLFYRLNILEGKI